MVLTAKANRSTRPSFTPAFTLRDGSDQVAAKGVLNFTGTLVLDQVLASKLGISYTVKAEAFEEEGDWLSPLPGKPLLVHTGQDTHY